MTAFDAVALEKNIILLAGCATHMIVSPVLCFHLCIVVRNTGSHSDTIKVGGLYVPFPAIFVFDILVRACSAVQISGTAVTNSLNLRTIIAIIAGDAIDLIKSISIDAFIAFSRAWLI